MPYSLIIAEKPSVARDIARVLGARERAEGYIDGGNVRVTWAVGHLVSLAAPEDINPAWKKWRAQDLPMLPEEIPLQVLPKTKKQYSIIRRLICDKECTDLVCATDAGREGELIFRYIYRMVGAKKPFTRLWISSMTDEAIREGFAAMKPGAAYDNLYESARCRSEADWLVGMNASRAYTLRYDVLLSIGRVQTPTLALLVRRYHEIATFVPKDYWTVRADFGDYSGLWLNEATQKTQVEDEAQAKAIALKTEGKPAVVERVTRTEKRELPPQLYDLTSLQRDANRLLGFTAKKTLTVAQTLYEERKLLTYPRTDSRHLPRDMAGRTHKAIEALPQAYQKLAEPLLAAGALPMTPRVFDDKKVTDHHAILPTGKRADLAALPADERALYDLVARRMLAAFYAPHLYDATQVITRCEGEPFQSNGRSVRQMGWKAVYADMPSRKKTKAADEEKPLPDLIEGDARTVRRVQVKAERTKPPAPHTDASLLAAMEHAGRELEDEALRESMKSSGLGTPATRAAIIERLLQVGYAARKGRAIEATEKGVQLIAVVPEDIASPETTGKWEKALSDIASGGMQPDRFLDGIRRLAASLVGSAVDAPKDVAFAPEERRKGGKGRRGAGPSLGIKCPVCAQGDVLENSKAFYCARWKEGCSLKIWKDSPVRAGGPMLTAQLVKLVIEKRRVQGSTGTLVLDGDTIRFEPKQARPTVNEM